MQKHQQRVIDEKAELDEKIEKLRKFTLTDIFKDLGSHDKILLSDQLYSMSQYSDILEERISLF